MNLPSAILFVFLASVCALHGQAGDKPEPIPAMNQIAMKPARACWTEAQNIDSGRKAPIAGDYPIKVWRLVFDGSEFSATTFADGKTTKRWKVGTITVAATDVEGREEVFVDEFNRFTSHSSKAGGQERFQGLEWISMANYKGTASLGGTVCWHFEFIRTLPENASSSASVHGPVSVRKAWIDAKTGLPAARFENGAQIVYRFEPPPSGPVPFTPAVQDFVRRYREKMSRYCPGKFQ